jgi:hypothetical protein
MAISPGGRPSLVSMTKLRLDRLYGGSGGLAAFSIMKTQTALTEKSQTSTSRQPASVDDLHRGSESSFGKLRGRSARPRVNTPGQVIAIGQPLLPVAPFIGAGVKQ